MFCERLKGLRSEKNLTQEELADLLNISRQAVSNYEKGEREPDFNILCRLADFFNVSVDYLLGVSNIRNIDSYVLIKSFRETFKRYPPEVITFVETACTIISNYKTPDDVEAINTILSQILKFMQE